MLKNSLNKGLDTLIEKMALWIIKVFHSLWKTKLLRKRMKGRTHFIKGTIFAIADGFQCCNDFIEMRR